VPHIPPTLCNLYQHGGDLLYLQMTPGSIKFLTEQPMFFITGIWSSSLVKLHHYGKVLLGMQKWKGRGRRQLQNNAWHALGPQCRSSTYVGLAVWLRQAVQLISFHGYL
jgi:hypothetical protein